MYVHAPTDSHYDENVLIVSGSVIKRQTGSISSTISGQTDTGSGQTSTTSGQTNEQTSTTSVEGSTVSG